MMRSVDNKIFMWHAPWRIHILSGVFFAPGWTVEDQMQIQQMGSLNGEEI